MSYRKSLAVLLLGGVLGFMFSPAHALWGGGGGGGWPTPDRLACYYDGLPDDVAQAVDDDDAAFPAGAGGFQFSMTLGCFEKDGTECDAHTGQNGIRTVLPGGFQISDPAVSPQTITRTDGGSFITDGFLEGMTIGVRTPLNGIGAPTLPEVTIAAGGVTDGVITIEENTLFKEGTGVPASGKIFSSRVDVVSGGSTACASVADDGVTFNPDESPTPVGQFTVNMNYNDLIRECDDTARSCTWTAPVTDALHTIDGHAKIGDGTQFVNHGCAAGEACTVCGASPDNLNKKTLDNYPMVGAFEEGEAVTATEVNGDDPPVNFFSRYPASFLQTGDETVCADATIKFSAKGQDTGGFEEVLGILQIFGELHQETWNVATAGGVLKFRYLPNPGIEFANEDIDPGTLTLENAPAVSFAILGGGSGESSAEFLNDEVAANSRAAQPFVDGEIRTLISKGLYVKNRAPGSSPVVGGFCAANPDACAPFEARDNVTVTESVNDTVQFAAPSFGDGSCVNEPAPKDSAIETVTTVQVSSNVAGIVTVDLVDTGNGSAGKNDYGFTPNPTQLVFDPSDPNETFSREVNVTIKGDNPFDPGETIILQLVNKTGPANLGTFEHTVTIDPPILDQDGNIIGITQCTGGVPQPQ